MFDRELECLLQLLPAQVQMRYVLHGVHNLISTYNIIRMYVRTHTHEHTHTRTHTRTRAHTHIQCPVPAAYSSGWAGDTFVRQFETSATLTSLKEAVMEVCV